MCGFVGAVGGELETVLRMPAPVHRGPDAVGLWRDGQVMLRHWRLAILGGAADARQPMMSEDGSVVVAFNGEIYNYRELAERLGRPELARRGDTRVLVEWLARHGLGGVEALNGMFAMAVWLRREGSLVLIRDRFGIKPVYYAWAEGGFYFASEIKCFAGLVPLGLDAEAVRGYLDGGRYPAGERTFYERVRQVEPGCWLRVHNGAVETCRWYRLEGHCRDLAAGSPSVEEYEGRLSRSVRLRLRSDVPISLHLSGGTDSTALLLKTKEVWGWGYPLVAYTMGFEESAYDESAAAAGVCDRVGVTHRRVVLSWREVPEAAERMAAVQDEPYGGVPTLAYLRMNEVERADGYVVSIEGQGGDETFGGYASHALMAMYDLYRRGTDAALLAALLERFGLDTAALVRRAEVLIASGFRAHTDLTDLRSAGGSAGGGSPRCVGDWLRTIQLYDICVNKLPRTLRFNDRAAMACGREVRFPLLDHHVLAYGLAMDHAGKYAGGVEKAPLRAIIRRHLPDGWRAPKRSVVTPQTAWLHGPLRDWAHDRVALVRSAGVLEARDFEPFERFYRLGLTDNSFYVWQLINLSFHLRPGGAWETNRSRRMDEALCTSRVS